MSGTRAPVTVIGLGPMGQAMVRGLLAGGHPTTVWNRTAGRADDLVAEGAIRATTVTDALVNELVVLSLTDYHAMYDILGPASGSLADRVVVNLSSDTPDRTREAATWLAERGAELVVGGIMVSAEHVGKEGFVTASRDRCSIRAAERVPGRPQGGRGARPAGAGGCAWCERHVRRLGMCESAVRTVRSWAPGPVIGEQRILLDQADRHHPRRPRRDDRAAVPALDRHRGPAVGLAGIGRLGRATATGEQRGQSCPADQELPAGGVAVDRGRVVEQAMGMVSSSGFVGRLVGHARASAMAVTIRSSP